MLTNLCNLKKKKDRKRKNSQVTKIRNENQDIPIAAIIGKIQDK
jgi:hypothetical protein